jgi:hypothetical protein
LIKIAYFAPESRRGGFLEWRHRVVPDIECEYFPLNDEEVDFDLIESAGMDWGVYEGHVGPFRAQAVERLLAAMGGAVV